MTTLPAGPSNESSCFLYIEGKAHVLAHVRIVGLPFAVPKTLRLKLTTQTGATDGLPKGLVILDAFDRTSEWIKFGAALRNYNWNGIVEIPGARLYLFCDQPVTTAEIPLAIAYEIIGNSSSSVSCSGSSSSSISSNGGGNSAPHIGDVSVGPFHSPPPTVLPAKRPRPQEHESRNIRPATEMPPLEPLATNPSFLQPFPAPNPVTFSPLPTPRTNLSSQAPISSPAPPTTLHTNLSSQAPHPNIVKALAHTQPWSFGALGELVDNSSDAKATIIDIDMCYIKEQPVLTVTDNGNGMSHQDIDKMMCYSHTDTNSRTSIGKFGVGFKSGAMRLGQDALVLTKQLKTYSLAYLSQTLNATNPVMYTPIVTFVQSTMEYDLTVITKEDAERNLNAVFSSCPISNALLLGKEYGNIRTDTGTRIMLFKLEEYQEKLIVVDGDIRIQSTSPDPFIQSRPNQQAKDIPPDYSLKAYLQILYRPRHFTVRVCNNAVPPMDEPFFDSSQPTYTPTPLPSGRVTFGYREDDKKRGNCGMLIYWHNRLVEMYMRVGVQASKTGEVYGILGLAELDEDSDIVPNSNKQALQRKPQLEQFKRWLTEGLDHYFYTVLGKEEMVAYAPATDDSPWFVCCVCNKKRKLMVGQMLPRDVTTFECSHNNDPKQNRCELAELPEAVFQPNLWTVTCYKCKQHRVVSHEDVIRKVAIQEFVKSAKLEVGTKVQSKYQLDSGKWSAKVFNADITHVRPGGKYFSLTFYDGLKQAKVPFEKITQVLTWDCSMNDDPRYNSCDKKEEEESDLWVQCNNCRKWRKLEPGVPPETWYCRENPDEKYNSCEKPQDPSHATALLNSASNGSGIGSGNGSSSSCSSSCSSSSSSNSSSSSSSSGSSSSSSCNNRSSSSSSISNGSSGTKTSTPARIPLIASAGPRNQTPNTTPPAGTSRSNVKR